MKVLKLTLMFLLITTHSLANTLNTYVAKELIFMSTLLKDYKQTVIIAKSNGGYTEQNGALGRHPHKDNVRAYMASCLVGHAIITYILFKYSNPLTVNMWQDVWTIIETHNGEHNDNIGLTQRSQYNYAINYSVDF